MPSNAAVSAGRPTQSAALTKLSRKDVCTGQPGLPAPKLDTYEHVEWPAGTHTFVQAKQDLVWVYNEDKKAAWGRLSAMRGHSLPPYIHERVGKRETLSFPDALELERRGDVMFLNDSLGRKTTLVRAESAQDLAILQDLRVTPLPDTRVSEYLARLPQSPTWPEDSHLYVDRPKYKSLYDFNAYIIAPEAKPRALKVNGVERLRDGGTTYIDTSEAMFHFPSQLCGVKPASFTLPGGQETRIEQLSPNREAAFIKSLGISAGDSLALPPLPDLDSPAAAPFADVVISTRSARVCFLGAPNVDEYVNTVVLRTVGEAQELCVDVGYCTYTYILDQDALYTHASFAQDRPRKLAVKASATSQKLFDALKTVRPGDPVIKVWDIFREVTGHLW